ncbi:MAG: discoidin domain-containing protein [Gallionellaceae bacterium]|nr:discoidin domain-containing protein [Gallionellaceae bacterium]
MPGLATFARFLSALSLAFLPALFFTLPVRADDGLRADKTEIAAGETTTVHLQGASGWFKTRWHDSPDGIVRFDSTSDNEARVTALKPGRVTITAKVLTSSYSLDIKVLDAPDKKDPKGGWHTKIEGMAKVLGFPDTRARIVRMLAEVNSGSRSPQSFYADLAKLPANMFDVIEVRSKLVDGNPVFARDVLGATQSGGGTPVEQTLLSWRRDQTLSAIDEVVKRFVEAGRMPKDGYSMLISHVGKWASQDLDALTFTGDIDFSFVCNDVELAQAMKDAYAEVIKRRTGLDPIALDSVATAHGKAGLEVYIGKHGMAFAEEQMKINQLVDMSNGSKRKIEFEDVTLGLSMERAMAETFGKEPPKPAVDTEPGLSMEMVRHFGHDIVKTGIYDMSNAVVKAAKYLDRSYKSLAASGGQPADADLAKFAADITAWANTKPQSAAIRENMVNRISEYLGSKPKAIFDEGTQKLVLSLDAGQIAAFHEKATQAMWKTVEQGSNTRTAEMETRLAELTERKRRGDNVDEDVAKLRKDMAGLVDMVEAEVKAFKDVEVPKVVIDNNAKVNRLINVMSARFGTKVLSAEELKDKKFVEELLKAEGQHGSEVRRQMTASYIMERSLDALARSPEIAMSGVEKTNQMLDFIDDGLLGSIRGETGFSDFETEMKFIRAAAADPKTRPGALKSLNALKSKVALGVKATNQYLNQKLQGTAAGRQGMKFMMVYGLADEMKSYRDAFDQDGWGGFATEIFRRRIPLGSAVEGVVMGNTYRAGWDVVTTLIPPLALPEAAWGLGTAIGTQTKATYWNEQLSLFVDSLYDSATFKLIEMEQHDKAKVGVYRLVSVKHRGIPIDLSQFAAMQKTQVDALREQIGKGRLDWGAYKREFQGLSNWMDVDTVLQKTIADSDPGLALIEEMMNHPNVGPKLMDRLTEKGLVRWEEVKLGFITNLIKRLEDRKQADQALNAGMLPDLFLELRKAAADLEIEDAMLRALDAEVDTNNLKALMNWLWEAKRNVQGQAPTESETTRAAQVVKKYLDTYQGIVKSRDSLLASLPAVAARDGSTRYLTTDLFLSGRAAADKDAAAAWVKHVGSSLNASSDALLAIKKEYLPNLALDADDQPYLERVFPRELWMKPYKDAGIARQKTWLLDRAIDHGKARNAILDEYKAWLEKQAPVQLSVTVLDALDGKKQVGGASGDLKPTDILGKPGTGKPSGNTLVFGVPSGRYRLTLQAPGYEDASQDVLLGRALNPKPSLTVKLTPTGKKDTGDLAQFIASALQARDWKALADRLDSEKKSDLKMQNVVAWQAHIDALNEALLTLKKERMEWALAWQSYIDALNNIDSSVWDKLTRQVEQKRGEVEERCWSGGSASEDSKKRTERCQKEGQKFEASCVGTWPDQHWEEMKRIRMAKQELPDAVLTLHSAGYFTQRAWFEAVEKLTEKYKLPFPYPKPVTPRLKYALSCANVDLPTGKKNLDDLSAIKVTVAAPSASLPFGKSVTLNASASGGKSPYNFAWSSGGSGNRVSVTPRWAGEWTVTVTASDADGKRGEGSATLHVSPAQVKLQGTQPTVFYGSSATLSLPGKEPPPPAPDPCAGRGYTASNPFDECIRITSIKTVTTDPRWDAGGVTPPPPEVDSVATSAAAPTGSGKQQVVWQAEPALTFNPPTSGDGKTKVSYDRMGEIKLWCEIQEQVEGAFHTVGECGQETVKVIAPKFSVTFTPPEGQGRVGQDIRASISSQPGVTDKLIDFRWFDPPSSNRMELSTNAREIGFKLKDAKPVVLKALARVPYHGDEIADISATYTGQVYQVKAWAEEAGTRPMMWDAKKGGLVPVPKGSYATHERIPLRAEIQGGGAPAGVRWNWTVNEDTTISNPISQTPTVSRSSAGGISAHVEARDSEGALLGSGDVSLSVIEVRDTPPAPTNLPQAPTPTLTPDKTTLERGQSVSISAEVNGGKAPYSYTWQGASGQGARVTATPGKAGNHVVSVIVRDSKGKSGNASLTLEVQANQADRDRAEATRLGDQAIQQLQQGDLPGAINTARQGNKLDPAAARAAGAKVASAAKTAGWRNVYDRDFVQAVPNLEAAHELDPGDKDAADKLDKAKRFAQVWPQVEAKAREFDAQMADKKVWTAQKTMLQMQDLQFEMTGGMANPLSKRVSDDFNAGIAEYNHFMQDVHARHSAAFKEKNWQAMLDNAQEALKREHVLANEKELNGNVAFAKQMLREEEAKNAAAKPTQPVDLGAVGGKKGAPRTVNNVSIDDGSWVRFKSTDEKRLTMSIPIATPTRAAAVAIVSNLDDATYLDQGKTIARITVIKDTGDETLDIQAGVHSSEWNYGTNPKHAWVKESFIGGDRFLAVLPLQRPGIVRGLRIDYVDSNAPKWSGHAPGFCLRGISLVENTKGITLTPSTGASNPQTTGGLIAAYALDGDARDRSGNNRHGTVQGAKAVADRFGHAGAAMQFDGRSFIELPIDINPGTTPRLTFTAWVRADDISPIRQVMSHDDGGFDRSLGIDSRGGGAGWSLFTGSGGVLGFKPVEKGRWTFVAGVWDQTTHKARLQIDAQIFEKAGDSGGSGHKLNLGRNPGYGEYFVGAIDDVRLYDRALDANEINAIRTDQGGGTMADSGAAASYGDWDVVETTPGMYRLEQGGGQVKIARQKNSPGGLQHAGLRLNRGLPVTGDFTAQVSFSDARIEGGLNQIELHASFADGSIFFVVRDREGGGSHIWAPGLQGNASCGRAGTLRMERRGETVTGYCDGRAIGSATRKAALTRLQFVLQNNGSNDPISATFRDWKLDAATAPHSTNASGLAGTWNINANNYIGKLELTESGGNLAGRVWYDAHQVWEDLRNITFDGRTLKFLRPGPSQRYSGTLSGNEIRGTFDQAGGGSWNWVITRVSAAPPPEAGITGVANLARGKPASQSSRSQWSRPDDPQGAVDGVINGSYGFHTNNEANPWWQVDLGAPYPLTEARIHNRIDSNPERARTLQVMLSDDGRNWRTVYRHNGSIFGGKDGKPLVVSLKGESARYLRIQLNEANWFHLDEVEVMGSSAYTPSDGGRDYSGRTPQPASSAPPAAAATLLEQVDAIKDTWKGLKGLFGK